MLFMDVTYRYMGISHSLEMDKERPFFILFNSNIKIELL